MLLRNLLLQMVNGKPPWIAVVCHDCGLGNRQEPAIHQGIELIHPALIGIIGQLAFKVGGIRELPIQEGGVYDVQEPEHGIRAGGSIPGISLAKLRHGIINQQILRNLIINHVLVGLCGWQKQRRH